MKTQRFTRRWQQHYRKLLVRQRELLRQIRDVGGREEIHDLRVALRRLRLMVRVAGSIVAPEPAERFGRWSHRILKTTSRLRDCDAALEWLAQQGNTTLVPALLERHRRRLWQSARSRIEPLPSKIHHRLARVALNPKDRVRLARRFQHSVRRLESSIARHLPDLLELDAGKQHALRRKLRRLRYLFEIEVPHRKQPGNPVLMSIVYLQTAMGERQNLLIARKLFTHTMHLKAPSNLIKAAALEQSAWEKKIRRYSRILGRSWTRSEPGRRVLSSPASPPAVSGETGS